MQPNISSIPPNSIIRLVVDIPDNLPEGVQEQIDLFLADYPKTGPTIVKRYLALVLSEKYRTSAMGRSENQLQYPNRVKEADGRKKDNRKNSNRCLIPSAQIVNCVCSDRLTNR